MARPPTLLQAYVIETTTGSRSADDISIQSASRGNLFAVVDEVVAELDRRFTSNDELLHAVAACDPHSSSFLSADSLLVIADNYAHLTVCKDRLPDQCEVAKNMFSAEGSDRPLCK